LIIVKKDISDIINVHVREPFKLQENQAARVLEANMRIDLLNILIPKCETEVSEEKCIGAPSKVEISVSNYLFSMEQTGKEVPETDYLETVVEEPATEVVSGSSGAGSGSGSIQVPPLPFEIYVLAEGESIIKHKTY